MNASTKNRILMLVENQTYPRDFRVRREATALTEAGYEVSIVCPADVGQPLEERLDGVHVYRYAAPRSASGFLGYLWEYAYSTAASFVISFKLFFSEGFDVIHAHNPPDTFVFIAAFFKLLGKRFVFDHHDLSPEMYQSRFPNGGSRLVHRALLFLENLTCRLADHVIATNESYKRVEMERDGVPEERITIVRNGIELHGLHNPEADQAIRPDGKTIIGYVGVMGFQDGVDYLLRALRHLLRDLGRSDFFCVLVGGGDAFADLKTLAQQFGLSPHILFTGMVHHTEVALHLGAADICVAPEPSCPYHDRSTAVKMIEYMSLAKPIVAFDLPEHRYTAQGAAAYATPNDELEFARILADLMDNPMRRKAMGQLGRKRIETELAWEFSVPELLRAYRAILPASASSRALSQSLHRRKKSGSSDPISARQHISAEGQGNARVS
jgi:glycosyltransferase involved in cell wall biosynthesis